ncbi:serine protease [Pseudomaricurvus alkylphenolicus]|uniref:S1C family serine protease n=1 Tax=Pseudomaricurvus alkylphenolicus TaxID=1306991 RepID=UPI00141D9EE5|nr:serine protease [Pseudomaricurvus alkylphenolicus]NIB39596.1 serine protease [Pseudomaricurvus alkylphenolicus]
MESKKYSISLSRFALLVLIISGLSKGAVAADTAKKIERLKDAVVKIHTTSTPPDYFTPWSLLNAKQSSGSGSVIRGNRILTNAHVVADATYIQAQKHGDPRKYLARVAFVSHEADLALLEVEDPSFFKGLRPLKIGDLPEPLQEVSVFGYPFGGTTLSITKGILSRVEHQFYAHAGGYLLAGQIDAAINPGNSGGPVIVDNRIAGVVMQANTSGRAENLGYFVPPSVIKHVLKDAEDGQHDGFPDLGFRSQELDSPAMRQAYGVADRRGGMLVAHVFEGSPADGKLLPNDVIVAIDGYKIADDSSIEFRKNLRTNFKYAIDQYHRGDNVDIYLVRAGEEMKVTLQVAPGHRNYSLVRPQQFEQIPQYLIYGGVVFVPLNMNLIKRWGRDWHRQAPVSFLHARNSRSSTEKQELVVALKVLAADVNLGYHDWKNWILSSVNGEPIRDFEQFCRLVLENQHEFTTLLDDQGYQMVINHAEAVATEAQILARYRVPRANGCQLTSESEPQGLR